MTLFSVFAFGLIAVCFLLLLQEVVLSRQMWAEIPRVCAGLLAPVPIALFIGFAFASRAPSEPLHPDPRNMTLSLLRTILLVLAIGWLLPKGASPEELGIGPVITQAAVFSSSLINLFFAKNALIASLLSGVSIGLTVFVIFFN